METLNGMWIWKRLYLEQIAQLTIENIQTLSYEFETFSVFNHWLNLSGRILRHEATLGLILWGMKRVSAQKRNWRTLFVAQSIKQLLCVYSQLYWKDEIKKRRPGASVTELGNEIWRIFFKSSQLLVNFWSFLRDIKILSKLTLTFSSVRYIYSILKIKSEWWKIKFCWRFIK